MERGADTRDSTRDTCDHVTAPIARGAATVVRGRTTVLDAARTACPMLCGADTSDIVRDTTSGVSVTAPIARGADTRLIWAIWLGASAREDVPTEYTESATAGVTTMLVAT